MTDTFYGNGYVKKAEEKEFYLKSDTLIYNLYRALTSKDTWDYGPLVKEAYNYLYERKMISTDEDAE